MKLKVMSFNLRYWNEADGKNAWPNRKEQVAQLILAQEPLVLGIQEGLYPMLLELDAYLTDYTRVGKGRMGPKESEFCAIYYRKDLLSVEEVKQIWLSETPNVVGSKSWDSSLARICTWGHFTVKATGHTFVIFNTHLDHMGEIARMRGAELIWTEMEPYVKQGLSCVLTGDFNCTPDSEPIQFLRSKLVDAAEKKEKDSIGTFHNFTGQTTGGPIDYIFLTSNIRVEDVEILTSQQGGCYPSDHFPVVAEIELG